MLRKRAAIAGVVMYAGIVVSTSAGSAVVQAGNDPVYIGGSTRSEEAHLQRWLTETYAILRSDRFHQNLVSLDASYGQVWMSSWENHRKPSELAGILRLIDPTNRKPWWVPTPLALVGAPIRDAKWPNGFHEDSNFEASAGWTGYIQNGIGENSMRIGRVHYDRYLNGQNLVERSCAFNTLAHEISHTLSKQAGTNLQYIMDTESGRPQPAVGVPYASYLIGTVAQCTFLQNQGRITTDAQFKSCLQVFGTATFNSNSCDDYADDAPFPAPSRPTPPQPMIPAG